jgi:hypothetical protein
MTKEEAKAYALKIATESGVAHEVATQIAGAFDNEKFFNGFVPRPEVDRALSSEQQKYQQFKQRNEYLEGEWYPTAKKAHDQALQVSGKLQKYQQLYGEIDEADPNAMRRAATATGLTQDQVSELLNQRVSTATSSLGQELIEYTDIKDDYQDRFKKRLPRKELEAYIAEQRRAGKNDSLTSYYEQWVRPQEQAATPHRFSEEELKARDKRIAEEATRDYASRHKLPVADRPREAHLLFDRTPKEGTKTSADQSSAGRDAFLSELNDPRHYESA